MLPAQSEGLTSAPPAPGRPREGFGIVAGGGRLPQLLSQAAARAGWTPVVVTVADGQREDWARVAGGSPFSWGRTGDVFPHFRRQGVRHVAFCGTISVRPDYRSLVPSLRTLALLPEILRITRGGDDSLLRAVGRAFERRGFVLHAVHEFLPELLTPAGVSTRAAPTEADRRAIERASRAADWLGAEDIGQAAVASPERVIALEGIEGTREMLGRVADLRRRGRIGRSERCVLVKRAKPQQDHRFDLPSVGVETVRQAIEAGLSGIALSAGTSLLIDAQGVVERADHGGLFLYGMTDGDAGATP